MFNGQKKNKNSARAPAVASARIAPNICQGQLQTMFSECPKYHPNPFTSGEVITERVNIVQMRHKVFPILGEATASSPSKKLLSSNISSTCSHNMVNFGPSTAEIGSGVWGTPANFNGFRVLAALLHARHSRIGRHRVSQTLRR